MKTNTKWTNTSIKTELEIIENRLNNFHSKLSQSSLKGEEYDKLSQMLTEIKQFIVDKVKPKYSDTDK